eukprot:8441204-Heterocapsa_arctica.AAC.1
MRNELGDRRPGSAAAAEWLAPGGSAASCPSLGAHRGNPLRQRRRGGRPWTRAVEAAACGRQVRLARSEQLRICRSCLASEVRSGTSGA